MPLQHVCQIGFVEVSLLEQLLDTRALNLPAL
jgi:hypothetical protein